MKTLILAGGCFWGVEAYFKQLKGVVKTSVGYANGNYENPTYKEICEGLATHAEAVEIVYDPKIASLDLIFDNFFKIIDPTSLNKQGNDRGIQYRSGIYYTDLETKEAAQNYILKEQKNYSKQIVVSVEPLEKYYLAETYHQDYLAKNPQGYCHIDLGVISEEDKK